MQPVRKRGHIDRKKKDLSLRLAEGFIQKHYLSSQEKDQANVRYACVSFDVGLFNSNMLYIILENKHHYLE